MEFKMTFKLDSKINNIWLSSDWHYSHSNIVRYANRPFKDVEEMNAALITNYNSVVSDKDIVFFLGDIAFGGENVTYALEHMKGTIHYILGNHDKRYVDLMLYGHAHGRLPPIGKQWDVGVDNNGFKPLSFADVVKIMDKRPHNENYLPEEKRIRQ
jgi:calcineurin-like phosphoesterase family protein